MINEEIIKEKGLKNTEFLANFFGRSSRYIRQLAFDKVLKGELYKRVYYFDLVQAIKDYIRFLNNSVDKKENQMQELKRELTNAEIREKRAKAEKAEMELKEFKVKLLPCEEVKAYSEDLLYTIKEYILALSKKIINKIDFCNKNEYTVSEISNIIETEINNILFNLSEYEFNQQRYNKRKNENLL